MAHLDKLLKLLEMENVAEDLKPSERLELANKVCRGYKIDRDSRSEWEERAEDSINLAKQITEKKDFPWEGASNVIIPLLTTAANVFASRMYPEIIKGRRIVKPLIIDQTPDENVRRAADMVSAHMSYQRLIESDTWETDLDKLLHILPIVGVCFRKLYYDSIEDTSMSDLCSPQDVVLNHSEASVKTAYRITHRYYLNKNQIIEKIRSGHFIKFDVDAISSQETDYQSWDTALDSYDKDSINDEDNVQIEFLEQHTYADLDGDGYEEPWIVVVNKNTNDVVGIYPRFTEEDIRINNKGDIAKIEPTLYFIDYHFIPSPDGGFYSLGYGHLLYPINKSLNTLTNQLIDNGTLANTNSGLYSRDLKIKGGSLKLKMGELVPVNPGSTGKIADSIHHFDFQPPSPVLLNLLQMLMSNAKEIASINEVLLGEANPQNSPANSVAELANQGMKPLNAIAKRLYRSLKKEFEVLFKLNGMYLQESRQFAIDSELFSIRPEDYTDPRLGITPIADPSLGADMQRSLQANAINLLMQNPSVIPELKLNNVVREFFESLKIPEDKIDELLLTPEEKQQMQQNQPPDIEQQKLQLDIQKMEKDFQVKLAQIEKGNRELEIKYLELQKKYEIKQAETDEKQARMMADAKYKNAQAENMDDKLDIERDKIDVMRQKATKERQKGGDE